MPSLLFQRLARKTEPSIRPERHCAAGRKYRGTTPKQIRCSRSSCPGLGAELDWDLAWLAQPLNILLIVVAVILVLVLAWLIVKLVRERERGQLPGGRTQRDRMVTADRIEALPFLRDRSQHDLLGQARYHYERGNYSEAIIYLFSYELVELDRSRLVRLAKGKTNRQYLREAGRARSLAGLLERTMVTFEEVFFGRHPLDRAGFEACWNQLPQFKALISQSQATV